MKKKINKILDIIIVLIIIALYVFAGIYLYTNFREKKRLEAKKSVISKVDEQIEKNKIELKKEENNNINNNVETEVVVKYNNYKYTVLGKIKIDKLNLNEPIFKENTKSTLDAGPIKVTGPSLNSYGNVVIGGHNYMKKDYFIKIKKLVKDDVITITDLTGESVDYYVTEYNITTIEDVSYMKKPTDKNVKMITLVTCTNGAVERYYVKAIAK